MAQQWEQLSKRQQEQFGSKSAFKDAKKATRKAGGDVSNVKSIKTTYNVPASTPSKVTDINKYDTTSYGAGASKGGDRLSAADLRELSGQGFSDQEVVDYAESKYAGSTKGGGKAQSLLAEYKTRLTKPAPTPKPEKQEVATKQPTQEVATKQPTQEATNYNSQPNTPAPEPKPYTPQSARTISEAQQNVYEQYVPESKTSADLDNTQGAALYQGMNEDQYNRSKQTFNSQALINDASKNVQKKVKATEQFTALRQSVMDTQDYWRNRSKAYQLGIFGDIWNMQAPTWESPGSPSKIEADYDK